MLKKTLSKLWGQKKQPPKQREAIHHALRPYLSAEESDLWCNEWDKALAEKPEAARAPFLLITRFTNKVCAKHRLNRTAQKNIRAALIDSFIPNDHSDR